jgi:hypothetical protein
MKPVLQVRESLYHSGESIRMAKSGVLTMSSSNSCIAIVTMLAAIVSGCSKSSNGRVAVSGGVTLDGESLDTGVITFFSPQKQVSSAGAAITAGQFNIPADHGLLPGRYSVAIDSADKTGATARPDHQAMEIPISRIPPGYNGTTELSADVDPSKSNRFDFALVSDHKPPLKQSH